MRKNRKGQIHNEFRLLVLDDDEMITLAPVSYTHLHRKAGWALGLDMHHLISDGLTTPLLLDHLDRLYRGESRKTPLTYKDAAWAMQDGPAEADLEFWQKTLTPLPKPQLLPQDRRCLLYTSRFPIIQITRADIHNRTLL